MSYLKCHAIPVKNWLQLSVLLCCGACTIRYANANANANATDAMSMPQPASKAFTETHNSSTHPHSSMNHPGMDHSKMDHSAMQHESMQGMHHDHSSMMTKSIVKAKNQSALDEQRDPHAYSDGYDFGAGVHDDMGDKINLVSVMVDRLEANTNGTDTSMIYDWQAWYGSSFNKFLVRAEGEVAEGQFNDARNEVLWAHAISPFWDSQVGIRYDSGKGTDRGWLAFGVQGLAPYWLYVEATAYINEQGRTAFRFETEYDLLITQKLILQPRAELNFYSQSDPSRVINSGLSDAEVGVRLRYEIIREVAPYIGVEWGSKFGAAADQRITQGGSGAETRLVAGVHFWF